MHEMGVALEIIDIAIASIPKNLENVKIKKINVKLGKLSAVTPDNLKFCFDVISKDNSIIMGTTLSLEIIPIIVQCKICNFKSKIDEPLFKCKKCGDTSVIMLSGKELDICSIEIEEGDYAV